MPPYYSDPYQNTQGFYPHYQYVQPVQQQIPQQPQAQIVVPQQQPQLYQQPSNPQFYQQQWQQPQQIPINFSPVQQQQQSHHQHYQQPQQQPEQYQQQYQQQHQFFNPHDFQYDALPQDLNLQEQQPQQNYYQQQQLPFQQQMNVPRQSSPTVLQQHFDQPHQNMHLSAFTSQQASSISSPSQTIVRVPNQHTRVLQDVQPNMPRQQSMTKPPPMPEPEQPEPEYPSLLLNLADEYLDAANKLEERSEEYYKLVATGLACIETTLKNFKLAPIREAQLSLKYSQLLYDETTNYDDAESILTKSIELCERMKFLDLKYAMQLLLAKVLYQSKPRAAIRDLQGMIQDVETYHHVAWEYTFRFQHVLFSMDMAGSTDIHAAILHVERIQHVARQNGDHAIFAFAAILEALLHLYSPSAEAASQSQSALAKARSLQLNPDVENNPQMPVMVEFVNLACSISAHEYDQIEQKRRILQDVLYKSIESDHWNERGLIFLPISHKSLSNLPTQEGGLIHEDKGRPYIVLSWMGKDELEAVGFLLCGASTSHKNIIDGGKAERYMLEGLKIPQELLAKSQSRSNKATRLQMRWRILAIHFLLEAGFLQSSRGQWSKAQTVIKDIGTLTKDLDKLPLEVEAQIEYLKGCIQQGTGHLDEALNIFQSPILALQSQTTAITSTPGRLLSHSRETVKQTSMLAAMNTALIVHSPSHPRHYILQSLINNLDNLIHGNPSQDQNKHIEGAYSFLLAVMPNNTILRTKQYLSHALDAAKKASNNQIVGLTLTVMQEKFFKGVVPDTQAMKCAKAATHQVKTRWGDPMWIAVASGLEAECLGMLGNREESESKRMDAAKAMELVPEKVRQTVS